MRHRKKTKILGRPSTQRRLMLRNLAISLIISERIKTTVAKAKYLRPFVEKLITTSKVNNLASLRRLLQLLDSKTAARKLVNDIGVRSKKRAGGYTRITKLGRRQGDGAELAVIELVDRAPKTTDKTKITKETKDDKGKDNDKK
ncbi:50S ribosomal protein L17 [Patescibacteria group bacterium]|nr:50S ribosomal protein L17 [Patescibacteria group bacterium]MBU1890878.1 50S ribosomal protein L17 [Patescibacteria group bacterium]